MGRAPYAALGVATGLAMQFHTTCTVMSGIVILWLVSSPDIV